LFENLLRGVVGKVELVETGMGLGELMLVGVTVDGDPLDAVHADELGEPFDWDFGCSGDELDQLGKVLLAVCLNHFPEPNNDLVSWGIARVICILFQVLHIHFGHSGDQQLQFFGLEVRYALLRDDFVESLKELIDLCREAISHLGMAELLDVFFLVFFVYNDFLSAWQEFFLNPIAKVIVNVAKSKHIFVDGVSHEPLHGFVEFVILCL
jgi:hypothetical protein